MALATIATLILILSTEQVCAQNFRSVNLRVNSTETLYAEIPTKLGTSFNEIFVEALPLAGAENIVTFVKNDRLPMLQILKFAGRAELDLPTFSEVIREQFRERGTVLQNENAFTAKVRITSGDKNVRLKTFVNKFNFIDPRLSNKVLAGTLMLIPAKDFHLTVTFIEEARKADGNKQFRNRIFKSITLSTEDSFYFPASTTSRRYENSSNNSTYGAQEVKYDASQDLKLSDNGVSSTSMGKILIGLIMAVGCGLIYKKKIS